MQYFFQLKQTMHKMHSDPLLYSNPFFDYFVYIRIIISLLSGLPYKQKIQVTCLAITCIVLTYHQLNKKSPIFF